MPHRGALPLCLPPSCTARSLAAAGVKRRRPRQGKGRQLAARNARAPAPPALHPSLYPNLYPIL
jgi:hypothetical protein